MWRWAEPIEPRLSPPSRPDLGPNALPMWPGVEWDVTETIVVFLAAFGLAQYFGQIVFGVLELHGSLGATVATFLLEASGPAVIFGWLRSVGRPRPAWLGRAGRRAGDVGLGFVIGLALLFSSGI
ncbi:MAG: hypothetical protein QOI52_1856, partial [Chloroflexota bacterium]|nr:hypothetical protein [Chloroflexota bacterium]